MSTTALTVLPPVPKEISADFEHARTFYREAAHAGRALSGHLVLCGVELARLHKKYGVRRGRPGKVLSTDRQDNHEQFVNLPWAELVEQEMGFSHDKARYCMDMARKVGRKVEIVRQALLAAVMTDKAREALTKVVHKIADGQTVGEFLLAWGITKSTRRGNPNPTGGDATSTGEKLTLEEQALRDVWEVEEPLLALVDDQRFSALIKVLPLNPEPHASHPTALLPLKEALEGCLAEVNAAISTIRGRKGK